MFFVIKTAAAFLYAEADDQSERVDEVLHGMMVAVESEAGDWLYVRTSYDYCGWLRRSFVCLPHDLVLKSYVNVHSADVLTAPKVQSPLIICLNLGCAVHVVSHEVKGWTQIALAGGGKGYIRTAFLSSFSEETERDALCRTAMLYKGVQYRWGGKSPLGIDCSGLCFMAYYLNGAAIFRDSRIKAGFPIKEIAPEQAKKGDLLYFPGHVGMLLDGDKMIHSSEANNGVRIESLTDEWRARITAVGSIF